MACESSWERTLTFSSLGGRCTTSASTRRPRACCKGPLTLQVDHFITSSVREGLAALLSLPLFFKFADRLEDASEAAQVLKFDIAQQPLRARWTYCNWCRRRCSPKETAETPGGVPVRYPCLGLHISRRRDCKGIVDKDEGLRTAKEQACLAERQPSEVDLGERESAVREEPVMTFVSSRLQLLPVQSCRSGVSRCRRPGLFWFGTSRSSSRHQLASWPFCFCTGHEQWI